MILCDSYVIDIRELSSLASPHFNLSCTQCSVELYNVLASVSNLSVVKLKKNSFFLKSARYKMRQYMIFIHSGYQF